MKYPFIGKSKVSGLIVLFYSERCGTTLSANDMYKQGKFIQDWFMSHFIDITTEYLRKTKIQIESPEHSEFVQKLVFNAGGSWADGTKSINSTEKEYLYTCSGFDLTYGASKCIFEHSTEKQITLPLPPKLNFPQVGDNVCFHDLERGSVDCFVDAIDGDWAWVVDGDNNRCPIWIGNLTPLKTEEELITQRLQEIFDEHKEVTGNTFVTSLMSEFELVRK